MDTTQEITAGVVDVGDAHLHYRQRGDGPPVLLNVASAPTFADAQAAITWSSGVTVGIKTDFKMKNLIGKGSGETVQLAFSGQGWVLVQPSEGRVAAPSSGGGSGGLGNLLGG